MQAIIDRFEGNMAVVELADHTMKNIPRDLLPPHTKEGDMIRETAGKYEVMKAETKARAEKIRDLLDEVWGD